MSVPFFLLVPVPLLLPTPGMLVSSLLLSMPTSGILVSSPSVGASAVSAGWGALPDGAASPFADGNGVPVGAVTDSNGAGAAGLGASCTKWYDGVDHRLHRGQRERKKAKYFQISCLAFSGFTDFFF